MRKCINRNALKKIIKKKAQIDLIVEKCYNNYGK